MRKGAGQGWQVMGRNGKQWEGIEGGGQRLKAVGCNVKWWAEIGGDGGQGWQAVVRGRD